MEQTHKNRSFYNERDWLVFSKRQYVIQIRLKNPKPLNSKDIIGIKISVDLMNENNNPEKREKHINFGQKGFYNIERYFTILAFKYIHDFKNAVIADSRGKVTGKQFQDMKETGLWANDNQRQGYIDVLTDWQKEKGKGPYSRKFEGIFDNYSELYYLIWLGGSSAHQIDAEFMLNTDALKKGNLIVEAFFENNEEIGSKDNNYGNADFSELFKPVKNPKAFDSTLFILAQFAYDRAVREESLRNLIIESMEILKKEIPLIGPGAMRLIIDHQSIVYSNPLLRPFSIEEKDGIPVLCWTLADVKECKGNHKMQIAVSADEGWYYKGSVETEDLNAMARDISVLSGGKTGRAAEKWLRGILCLMKIYPDKMKQFDDDIFQGEGDPNRWKKNYKGTLSFFLDVKRLNRQDL